MPFIQRIDYILLDLSIDDKALWKVQNEFDLYAIFERWGAEVFDEALEKIEDLGFELALHIFWHHNIFRPITIDEERINCSYGVGPSATLRHVNCAPYFKLRL